MQPAALDVLNPVGNWKQSYNGTTGMANGQIVYMEYADPLHVPLLMKRWMEAFNQAYRRLSRVPGDALGAYLQAHMAFVRIHPFFDGNGRVARLVANLPVFHGKCLPRPAPICDAQPTMKTFCCALLLLLSCVAALHAETVADISKRFASDKAKALETYLAANPQAADSAEAQALLADCYEETGNVAQQLVALDRQYATMPKGAEGDLRAAAMNLSKRMALLTDKAAAKEALATVKKDFATHKDFSQASRFLDSLATKLDQPGVGDTLTIAFTAVDGRKVDLAALKGKVVLVDFWATWCGPCVGEMPAVQKAFDAYHAKGFEIIGISLDQEKSKLESFVKEKGLRWPQSFDGKGWENEIARKYGIQGIPATFLIGKDGKIVAKDLRGPALEKKLAELLK
jgi:thiol-disulfide isomerase/thioredoxin